MSSANNNQHSPPTPKDEENTGIPINATSADIETSNAPQEIQHSACVVCGQIIESAQLNPPKQYSHQYKCRATRIDKPNLLSLKLVAQGARKLASVVDPPRLPPPCVENTTNSPGAKAGNTLMRKVRGLGRAIGSLFVSAPSRIVELAGSHGSGKALTLKRTRKHVATDNPVGRGLKTKRGRPRKRPPTPESSSSDDDDPDPHNPNDESNERVIRPRDVLGEEKMSCYVGQQHDLGLRLSQVPTIDSTTLTNSDCLTFFLLKLLAGQQDVGLFYAEYFTHYWQEIEAEPSDFVLYWPPDCHYFIVPILRNRHFLCAIYERLEGQVQITFCDSFMTNLNNEQVMQEIRIYEPALIRICKEVFITKSNLPPDTQIYFGSYSSITSAQNDDFNSAPYAATNICFYFILAYDHDFENIDNVRNDLSAETRRRFFVEQLNELFVDNPSNQNLLNAFRSVRNANQPNNVQQAAIQQPSIVAERNDPFAQLEQTDLAIEDRNTKFMFYDTIPGHTFLGDRSDELINEGCDETLAGYAGLDFECFYDFHDPTQMLNATCMMAGILCSVRDYPQQVGVVSAGFFEEANFVRLRDEPLKAFITKPEFKNLVICPIFQDRIHFTLAIFEQHPDKVSILFCDSFGKKIKTDVRAKLNVLLKALYPNETNFEWNHQHEFDLQTGEGVNCAAFTWANVHMFLNDGGIFNSGKDGFYKRFCLRNLLAPFCDQPQITEEEFMDILFPTRQFVNNAQMIRQQKPKKVRFDDEDIDFFEYTTNNEEIEDENSDPENPNFETLGDDLFDDEVDIYKSDVLEVFNDGVQNTQSNIWNNASASQPTNRPAPRSPPISPDLPEFRRRELRGRTVFSRIRLEDFQPRQIKGRGRGRPSLKNAAAIPQEYEPDPYDVGMMQKICPFCGAYLFANEKFSQCCRNGKVKMPELPRYSHYHEALLYETPGYTGSLSARERELNAYFKKNIVVLNRLLSFGSISFNRKDSGVVGAPVQLINGVIDYNMCHIEAKTGNYLKFGQLFTVENFDGALENLRQNPLYQRLPNDTYRKEILQHFYDYLMEYNQIAQGYKMCFEKIKEERERGVKFPKYIVNFLDERKVPPELIDPNLHPRQTNVPEAPEVAVLYVPVNENCPAPEMPAGIFLIPRFGKKPEVFLKNSPIIDSYMTPLVFPHGEQWYTFDSELQPEQHVLPDGFNLEGDPELEDFTFDAGIDDALMEEEEENPLEKPGRRKRKYASVREQICYRMYSRNTDHGIHHIWNNGNLGQQIIIKGHFEVVRNEVNYNEKHVEKRSISSKYVRQHYEKLLAQHIPTAQLGYVRRFPRYHKLSWQYQQRAYAKGLTLARKFGPPTFFITATANRNWIDLKNASNLVGLELQNTHFNLVRVFREKLKMLMHQIVGPEKTKVGIFGKCVAYAGSIEFQKRGNIHSHILVWIDKKDTELSADYVDNYVSARIPDPKNKKLYRAVTKHMLHTCTESSVCRDPKNRRRCTRRYPQKLFTRTQIGNGFVHYKRLPLNGGSHSFTRNGKTFSDANVVPYNPYLLLAWDGHINVEAVATQGTPGYAIKYILKGGSKVFVEILKSGLTDNPYVTVDKQTNKVIIDEAKYFFSMSYIAIQEAIANLLSFGPFFFSHTVVWIGVHLEKDTSIDTAAGETIEHLHKRIVNRGDVYSRLTAYFKYCSERPQETANMTYIEFNELYLYDNKKYTYRRALRSLKRVVAMYEVSVKNLQLLALRTILLYKKCVKSFEDAATSNDGIVNRTDDGEYDYVLTANKLGLMESDLLWRNALDQKTGRPIRQMIYLFAQVLLEGGVNIRDPLALWNSYKQYMCPPLGLRFPHLTVEQKQQKAEQLALAILDWHLEPYQLSRTNFGLPARTEDIRPYNADEHGDAENYLNDILRTGSDDDIPHVELNGDQLTAFDKIWAEIEKAGQPDQAQNREPCMFFLHGEGGSGKTTLYNQLLRRCAQQNIRACATATTGIAASLLKHGQTVHSRFFVPPNVKGDTKPNMRFENSPAHFIRQLGLLLVDEASQLHKDVFDFVLKTIRSVRYGNEVTRRLVIVFGGDFRQILPVVIKQPIGVGYHVSLIPERATGRINFLCLRTNRRTSADQVRFREFFRDVGISRNPLRRVDPFLSVIKLSDDFRQAENIDDLIEAIFPLNDRSTWNQSAIVTPHNATVDKTNLDILQRIPGQEFVYEAVNTPDPESVDFGDRTAVDAMAEAMSKIEETGFPPQVLRLKVGVKVMIIKNMDVRYRLCNGTPAIVSACDPDVITIRRIELNGNLGEEILLARHRFKRQEDFETGKTLCFTRFQYPIKLAFAMTINKAQGQTISRLGILLNTSVFSHGQLYVALTRVRRATDITIFNATHSDDPALVDNVVDPQVARFVLDLENQQQQ